MNFSKKYSNEHNAKSGKVSDKWDLYLEAYDEIVNEYCEDARPINTLEIGIQNGGSLETIAACLPNAINIVGCDINTDCDSLTFADKRISVAIGDATEAKIIDKLNLICNNYDIIIEDGSHKSSDIIKSFIIYFDKLNPGGVYIAEDLHCCYWSEYEGGLGHPYSGIEFFKGLADCLNSNHWGRSDIDPEEYMNQIATEYGVIFTKKLLSNILSIEFRDSMCIIRKAEVDQLSRICKRVIRGHEEEVVSGHIDLQSDGIAYFNQDHLTWKSIQTLDIECQELKEEIINMKNEKENIENEMHILYASRSWRITKPLRYLSNSINKIFRTK